MPKRPHTPNDTPHTPENGASKRHEWETPYRSAAIHIIGFLEWKGIEYDKTDIFRYLGISNKTAYTILASGEPRRLAHRPSPGNRGMHVDLPEEVIEKMGEFVDTGEFDDINIPWHQLALEFHVEEFTDKTIKNRMHKQGLYKFIACEKSLLSETDATNRINRADEMLSWGLPVIMTIRFSDKVYFGESPDRKAYIIRRKGQRYEPKCIKKTKKKKSDELYRFHCWGAIGYNFKSRLIFYTVPSNKNGKLTQAVYLEYILKREVGR